MDDFMKKCFVCSVKLHDKNYTINTAINLPVCNNCKGSTEEKRTIKQLINGMADGFVCGCI